MEMIVKSVEIGAEYEGKIYDYWIDVILKDGSELRLFDSKPFDLRRCSGQKIQGLIYLFMLDRVDEFDKEKKDIKTIKGVFLKSHLLDTRNYINPPEYLKEPQNVLRTSNGDLLIDEGEVKKMGIQDGESVILTAIRRDLIAVKACGGN